MLLMAKALRQLSVRWQQHRIQTHSTSALFFPPLVIHLANFELWRGRWLMSIPPKTGRTVTRRNRNRNNPNVGLCRRMKRMTTRGAVAALAGVAVFLVSLQLAAADSPVYHAFAPPYGPSVPYWSLGVHAETTPSFVRLTPQRQVMSRTEDCTTRRALCVPSRFSLVHAAVVNSVKQRCSYCYHPQHNANAIITELNTCDVASLRAQTKTGSIWNNIASTMTDWEVMIEYHVAGKPMLGGRLSDTLACVRA